MKELNTVEVQDVNGGFGGLGVLAVVVVASFLLGHSDAKKQA